MSEGNNNQKTQNQPEGNQPDTATMPAFDYDKLANLINGKQNVTEDTVLKSYFKQQGLSADEMTQAISAYKAQKAEKTPDVAKLQNDISSANDARMQAVIGQNATLEAVKQGVDVKSIPYVLKMADFSSVADEDGNINAEKLTEAIKTVLDDVPALRGNKNSGEEKGGIQKIGGDGGQPSNATEDALRGIFGIKK